MKKLSNCSLVVSRVSIALFVAGLPLWLGCGSQSERSVAVRGTVMFNGQLVSDGQVTFEPDAQAGNQGPAGFARIIDGHFDTTKDGKAVQGGPHLVRITGLSHRAEDPSAQILFREYWTRAELVADAGDAQLDFEVPQAAGAGLRPRSEPAP